MFDPSVPKRLKPHHIATIFNQKMYEALVWKMQQAKRFSDDNHEIKGSNIDLWEIVVGDRFADTGSGRNHDNAFAIVISKNICNLESNNHIHVMAMEDAFRCNDMLTLSSTSGVYFDTNNTFRTIRVDELPKFWAALEACYA